jgi:hypothetical protein
MKRLATVLGAVGLSLAVTLTAVSASSGFVDVEVDSTFAGDIAWLEEAGITRGCNPPQNDRFCPGESVTREQMAAFLHRFADSLPTARPTPDPTPNRDLPVP